MPSKRRCTLSYILLAAGIFTVPGQSALAAAPAASHIAAPVAAIPSTPSTFTTSFAVISPIGHQQAIADTGIKDCPKYAEVVKIIADAISMGAPIYNAGAHLACYRIYEGAAYKILYEYSVICKDVETILKTAVKKSHGDYSDLEKAWIMRAAFDKILGEPTQTTVPSDKG